MIAKSSRIDVLLCIFGNNLFMCLISFSKVLMVHLSFFAFPDSGTPWTLSSVVHSWFSSYLPGLL